MELTDELAALLVGVPRHPDQTELTPILKFIILQNVSAWDLRQAHVPALREWLKNRYTRANWSRAMKKSLGRWKRCQSVYGPRWPQAPLEPEYVDRDWGVKWRQMPRLEAVVDAHIEELQKPRKRRHGGFRKVMSESSLKSRKGHLRRMASAIHLALGVMPETLEQLTDPALVEAGAEYILEMRGVEKSGDLSQMLRHINAIARHHVRRPKDELQELLEIRKSVTPPQGPAEKNRKLLEKFRNPALRDLFVEAPADVLHKLRRKRSLNRADLIEGMLAFLAALLSKVPMRISEAMALKFGETVHDYGSGRNRQVIIDLPSDMVKNEMPRNAKLGPRLVALLDLYRGLIRKHLTPPGNPYLFPSSGMASRSADHMSSQLAAWTTRHVIRMTAHQWRHVVGYIYLLEHPGCYDTVRRFLEHRSVNTTIQYYAFVLEDDANESLDQTIDDLTDRAIRKLRRPRRGR
jgi:integrase